MPRGGYLDTPAIGRYIEVQLDSGRVTNRCFSGFHVLRAPLPENRQQSRPFTRELSSMNLQTDHPEVVIFPPLIPASVLVVMLLLHWFCPLQIAMTRAAFALGAIL